MKTKTKPALTVSNLAASMVSGQAYVTEQLARNFGVYSKDVSAILGSAIVSKLIVSVRQRTASGLRNVYYVFGTEPKLEEAKKREPDWNTRGDLQGYDAANRNFRQLAELGHNRI
jgi:hypothetical protein